MYFKLSYFDKTGLHRNMQKNPGKVIAEIYCISLFINISRFLIRKN